MNQDIAHCAQQVRDSDPDRLLATMTARPAQRGLLFVLYAFNLEVARAPWVTNEEMLAEMRLQWWRDAIDEIYTGAPVRRHFVVTPLAELVRFHDLPRPLFDAMIDSRRWDIRKKPHQDQNAFNAYIRGTSGALLELAARVLVRDPDPAILTALENHAQGSGIATLLRACPDLEQAGRFPLLDGRPEGIRTLVAQALAHLAAARPILVRAPKILRPALRCNWIAKHCLHRALANPQRVAQGRLAPSPARQKLMLLIKQATGGF